MGDMSGSAATWTLGLITLQPTTSPWKRSKRSCWRSRLKLRPSVIKTTRTERFSGELPALAAGCSFRAKISGTGEGEFSNRSRLSSRKRARSTGEDNDGKANVGSRTG
jgi:hypothetical protein